MEDRLILFFGLLAAFTLAIKALNRTATMRDELQRLRQRVDMLEREAGGAEPEEQDDSHGAIPRSPADNAALAPAQPAAVPQPAATDKPDFRQQPEKPQAVPPAKAPPPSGQGAGSASAPRGWRRQEPQANTSAASSSAPSSSPTPSPMGGVLTTLTRWFMQGNPLAKLGIVLLFLGLSYLLRLSVEYGLFPMELRLAAAAAAAIVLLVVGWRLRHRQPVYALILQGGATGVLYLTVFGAFRLWDMLPAALAFALLVVICAASVGLAILQKALSLAMLASLGGYLTPLLLSTGGGSHVGLFSFYLLLSAGILAVSARQHWRELNLLGLLFTFGVGTLWGLDNYREEFYLSCQLFLIANIILFGVLSVALSLRAQERGKQIVDGVLLFAPPLVGFGMQYAMTENMAWGPALGALGFGAFYIALAWFARRRLPSLGNMLVLAALLLGAGFVTLAIPLALSARWTAMAWALEGVGILWLGIQQGQRRMSYSGTALLMLAVVSGAWALLQRGDALTLVMIFSVLSLCWMTAGWLWRGQVRCLSGSLLGGGLLFWLTALAGGAVLAVGDTPHTPFFALGLLAASVWIWRYAARRLTWAMLGCAVWLLWPAMGLLLLIQIADARLFRAGLDNLAWAAALPSALLLLRGEGERLAARLEQGLHLTLFWMLLLAFAAELWWFVSGLAWGDAPWRSGLIMSFGAAVIGGIYAAIARGLWPFSRWPRLYSKVGAAPVALLLGLMLLFANLEDGVLLSAGYVPLVNPLEEGAGFALVALWAYSRRSIPALPESYSYNLRSWSPALLGGLLFWWLNGLLMRLLSWYGEIIWRADALWHSRLVQTSFALFWMLTALWLMIGAARSARRQRWFIGATLMAAVIAKLLLVDSAGGGLARAVAFIGVALLVLIIGYFSPLPPKEAASGGEEK